MNIALNKKSKNNKRINRRNYELNKTARKNIMKNTKRNCIESIELVIEIK